MFSEVKSIYTNNIVIKLNDNRLEVLDKLVALCNEDWNVDRSSRAKKLLKEGIVTIKDGYRTERYPYLELVLYRMPPILLSNNKWFMRSFKRAIASVDDPLEYLAAIVVRYHQNFKHNTNFHL
jgi:hypothetical protein